jgi:hypothetical protein
MGDCDQYRISTAASQSAEVNSNFTKTLQNKIYLWFVFQHNKTYILLNCDFWRKFANLCFFKTFLQNLSSNTKKCLPSTQTRGPILENNGMPLSIEKKAYL